MFHFESTKAHLVVLRDGIFLGFHSSLKARDYETAGSFGGLGKETFSRATWPDTSSVKAADKSMDKSAGGGGAKAFATAAGGAVAAEATGGEEGETFYLYVKDPGTARLVVSVEEESLLKVGYRATARGSRVAHRARGGARGQEIWFDAPPFPRPLFLCVYWSFGGAGRAGWAPAS